MFFPSSNVSASTTPTKFADLGNRKLAYRELGSGTPILLANRFRGNLDTWDPAFLDALAAHHHVVTFEFAGTSSSTGTQALTHLEMARDVRDLAEHLGLASYAVGGWSLGGLVAQVAITEFPEKVTHGVLIATRAPVANASPLSPAFLAHALKPTNDLADETVLFFHPDYEDSRAAAAASHARIALRPAALASTPMTPEQWKQMIGIREFSQNTLGTFEKMAETRLPVLAVLGEADISFPAKDWLDANGRFPSVSTLVFPRTGHAPHHQFPEGAADHVATFLRTARPR
jgi:pimeloyl-ACP methyl ester carboxylesterase